jgi:hypothetical protein
LVSGVFGPAPSLLFTWQVFCHSISAHTRPPTAKHACSASRGETSYQGITPVFEHARVACATSPAGATETYPFPKPAAVAEALARLASYA